MLRPARKALNAEVDFDNHLAVEFEVIVPPRLDAYLLRTSGLEVDDYLDVTCDAKYIMGKMPPPTNMPLPYFLAEKPVQVRVSLVSKDRYGARLKIKTDEEEIGKSIRDHLTRYSVEKNGEALSDREHSEVWSRINTILAAAGASYEKLQRRDAELTRATMEQLINLCEKMPPMRKSNIRNLFSYAAKRDREFAVRWLIKEFEQDLDPSERGDLSLRIWETAVPAVSEQIARLMTERPLNGDCGLPMALVKTKHPRAAEIIASVIHRKNMEWSCLEALGSLKAKQYAPLIQDFLQDPDPDVRRQAKKTLKKLGFPADAPPPPKNLIKVARIPEELEEWSANLDMDAVEPALKKLSSLVATGFGDAEIREVLGVVEGMKPEQTKAFRFSITFQKTKAELYVVLFMDDIDAPDLAIYSMPELISQFGKVFRPEEV